MELIILALLITLGIADLVIIYSGKASISTRVRNLMPKHTDHLVMVGILGVGLYLGDISLLNKLLIGSIMGHWFWND